tara:strand:+ start:114 stop:851 length:738 start_codon:yes stop_codon:yes gene_type:complete
MFLFTGFFFSHFNGKGFFMEYKVVGGEAFPFLRVRLATGETVKAESNAMVMMRGGLSLTGKMDGGIGRAIGRMFSGESLFMQEITADKGPGEVMLATFLPGTMNKIDIVGDTLLVQAGSFLACDAGVEVSTKVQSLGKAIFGGEGLFVSKVTGNGSVIVSSYGGIQQITLREGEEVVIDNGHLVAWDGYMDYKITKGGNGWFRSVLSGEVLALRFRGPGRIWIQSRNLKDFENWIKSLMPRRRNG